MPTYVYKFIDTGETIDVQQAFSDDALTEAVHPTSGQTLPVKKVFLPVGVTFKGGGFYKTDSRNGSGSSSTASPSGTTTDSSSSTTPSTPASSDSSSSSSSNSSNSSSSSTPAPAAATASSSASAD